jgi:hypothetical protein
LTAARLLARTKSATHAKRQHVLFEWRLLADDAFQALLYIHWNRIAKTQSEGLMRAVFAILRPNWPL